MGSQNMPHAHSIIRSNSVDSTDVEPHKDTCSTKNSPDALFPLSAPDSTATSVAMKAHSPTTASTSDLVVSYEDFDTSNIMKWELDHETIFSHSIKQEIPYLETRHSFPEYSDSAYHSSQLNTMQYDNNHELSYISSIPYCSYRTETNLTGLPRDGILPSHPPNAYQFQPAEALDCSYFSINGNGNDFLTGDDHEDFGSGPQDDEHAGYDSTYEPDTEEPDTGIQSSTNNRSERTLSHEYLPKYEDITNAQDQPYAQLIYRALMEAPHHSMILREIYDWFERNTDKAADKNATGWQNSIRHNLSMNGGFEKIEHPFDDTRRGYIWRLTDDAIRNGVKSTTRYRTKQPNKRIYRNQRSVPKRQVSGAKGGVAARRSAKNRKASRFSNDPYTIPEKKAYRSVPISSTGGDTIAHTSPMFNTADSPFYVDSSVLPDADYGYHARDDELNHVPVEGPWILTPSTTSKSNFDLFSATESASYNTQHCTPPLFPLEIPIYPEPMQLFQHHNHSTDAEHSHSGVDISATEPLWIAPSPEDTDEPCTPDSSSAVGRGCDAWGPTSADDAGIGPLGMGIGDQVYTDYTNGLV